MDTTMQNRVCLITGATSCMGQATAAALAHQGATVLLVARDPRKGALVRDAIRAASGNPQVEVLHADLASQQSIRALAATVQRQYPQIHVLVNNAGGIFFTRETTVDGLERTFALDHLGYFLLTLLLLDTLKASAPARIINVSSSIERIGSLTFADLQRTRRYNGLTAYAQAKLGNLLFTYELACRLAGTGVTVNAITPGPVATRFGAEARGMFKVLPWVFRIIGARPEDAAQTAIFLASAPVVAQVTGAAFYQCTARATSPQSRDQALQQRLWQASETLTGMAGTDGP